MELPELPKLQNTSLRKPAKPGLPPIGADFSMASGREQEAAEFAAAMGQAFAITKAQNRYQKAKARARGRAAQQAAERRKRR